MSNRPARRQDFRDIEAQAGKALSRDFWKQIIRTPLGEMHRTTFYVLMGIVIASYVFLAVVALLQISAVPDVVILPRGDAQTVMTHVHANFSAPSKEATFSPFVPLPTETWRFRQAYTFRWTSAEGLTQRVIIADYDDPFILKNEYLSKTVSVNFENQTQAMRFDDRLNVEQRTLSAFGGEFRAVRLSNLLLLVDDEVSEADFQELLGHFVSITAAEHRDFIPSPTP
jgi:hypothetical protein